jgi:hypothetical protein
MLRSERNSGRPPILDLAGMFWLCFALLQFELVYTKVMVVQHYGHLGYVVIGTALFGFALSGVLMTAWERLRRIPSATLVARSSLIAAFAMLAAYGVTSAVPLDFTVFFQKPLATIAALAAWYVALTLPFFFGGLAICSLLGRSEHGVAWLYGADLIGAGLGSIFSVFAIAHLGGAGVICASAVVAGVGAVMFAVRLSRDALALGVVACASCVGAGLMLAPRVGIIVHTPKRGFAQDRDDGRILATAWSAVSRIDVADEGQHYMIWFDGGSMQSHLFPFDGQANRLPDVMPHDGSGLLPYRLRPREHALILASSGGKEVIWALSEGTRHVTAVELDPVVCDMVRERFNDYLGGLFHRPDVELINEEGRSFIKRSQDQYDVIQQLSAYSVTMITTGAAAAADSYLLTVESIQDYLDHLTEDGVLCISREHGVKLFTTVLAALEQAGIDPTGRIYIERAVNTYNYNMLLLRKTPFPKDELARIAEHVRLTQREVFFAPDEFWALLPSDYEPKAPDPVARDLFRRIYDARSSQRTALLTALPFDATPATDNRPFYNRAIPYLSRIHTGRQAIPNEYIELAESARKFGPVPIGDVPAVAVLLFGALLAGIVIFVPLRRLRNTSIRPPAERLVMLVYFSMLGIGFIALEIVLLQRFILFVGSPSVAIALVLGTMLVFAGSGSVFLSPLVIRSLPALLVVFLATVALSAFYATQLEAIFDRFLGYPLTARCFIGMLLVMPLGLLLGVPFPCGLRLAHRDDNHLVAWAWALNGYMTVIGTTAISIITQFLGYTLMFLLGGVVYLIAGLCMAYLAGRRVKTAVTDAAYAAAGVASS